MRLSVVAVDVSFERQLFFATSAKMSITSWSSLIDSA
jgi:hypothetical protein